MSMFEISRAQGVRASEAVEPGMSVVVNSGDRIVCDQSFTEVSSITRIDNNLQLIVADNPPIVFNQFFSAPNSLIQFTDQQITNDALNKMLSVHLTSTDSNQASHEIFLSLGSAVVAQSGDNYYLNAKEFDVKDLHRHGEDLLIQSHDETEKTIAVLKGFFSKPEVGFELPQLHITDPAAGETQDMIVHPHSNIFQWEGEPLPIAIIGSLYGYYFNLQGADADKFVLVAKSADGELPPWMSFAHVGEGKYYLAGIPTPGSAGSTEIVINAYSIQNKIGFHTTQSFQLQIKTVDDTVTRPSIDDVAAAELRSLNEVLIAESYAAGIVMVEQMAYMTMPEIAVITGLAALNPAIFNQTFSTFATADQIYHLQGLGVEANLGSLNAIEIEQIRNEILAGEGSGVTGPHTIAAINNVQAAQGAGLAQATQPTSTSVQPSGNTTTMSTDMVSSGISPTGSEPTLFIPEMFVISPGLNGAESLLPFLSIIPPSIPPSSPIIINTLNLDGTNGFNILQPTSGENAHPYFGNSVAIIPTGDGFASLAIEASFGQLPYFGQVFLLPGSTSMPSTVTLDPGVNSSKIFSSFEEFEVAPGVSFGNISIGNVGNFSGIGTNDFFIGSAGAVSLNPQTEYIVFSPLSSISGSVDISTLVSSGHAMAITDSLGFSGLASVGGLGDVNGDGVADIVAFGVNSVTPLYVIFGSTTLPSSLDIATQLTGGNGFVITNDHISVVGPVGEALGIDITGDGFDAIAYHYINTSLQGVVNVIFGSPSLGSSGTVDGTTLATTTGEGVQFIIGTEATFSGGLGTFMANAGNFTGSGYDDLALADPHSGAVYVIYGSPALASHSGVFDVSTMTAAQGLKIIVPTGDIITGLAYVGDMNGDIYPDLAISVDTLTGLGEVFVLFGSNTPFGASINLSTLTAQEGFIIKNYSAGNIPTDLKALSGAGDLNGDGLGDLVFSNIYGTTATHVVFGANFNGNITQMGGSTPGTIIGAPGNEVIYGGAADQTIILGSGSNFVNTGAGHDTIDGFTNNGTSTVVYSPFDVSVHLSNGANTLWFEQDGTNANFITTSTIYHGIPTIDLRSLQELSGNSITLDAATVQSMTPENVLTINGDAHDTVYLVATDAWTTSSGFAGYTTYSALDNSRIEIQDGVHVLYVPALSPVHLDFTLSSLMDGNHGFELTATSTLYASNATIIQNGDGFGDLLVATDFGSSRTSPYTHAFLIQGQAAFHNNVPFNDASLSLTVFNNDTANTPINVFGTQVISTGDFNGDGVNDFLLGSFYGGPSLLMLGAPGGFTSPVSLSSSNSIVMTDSSGKYNNTSAGLGDVNGDGLSDIALINSRIGWGAVVFGTSSAVTSIDTHTLTGSNGFQISTPVSNNYMGTPNVAGVNFTGDGMNDIFVSFYDNTTGVGDMGVILGSTPVFSPYVNISASGVTGANGFIITNSAGTLLNPTDIGNFTGSGFDDIALSSSSNVYVIFGSAAFLTATSFDVGSLTGTNGFELSSGGAAHINSIAYLGDVNGDGHPDFAFVDSAAYGGLGAVYVIFGSASPFSGVIDYTHLTSNQGFVITDPSGILAHAVVGGGGDINGDGLGDITITSGGKEYSVFGANFNGAITQLGGPNPSGDPNNSVIQGVGSHDVIYAGSANHTILGGSGNTFIDSGTGHDIINGGTGINTIVYSSFDTSVDAGIGGPNTLWLENDGIIANLQNTTIFKDFDVINLRPLQSLQGNEVDLNPQGVANMSHTNTLQVDGGAHDALVLHNTGLDVWSAGPVVNIGGALFTTYSSAVTHSTVYAENTFINHVSII